MGKSVGLFGLAILLMGTAAQARTRVDLRNAEGRIVARAWLNDTRRGLQVRVVAAGLQAGPYAVHLHSVGRCEPPAFATAGPHWNPTNRHHGRLNPDGAHLGDLPNLNVVANGDGHIDLTIAGAALRAGEHPLLDADGTAIVVHADPDDYRTDPSGNSGGRIACGVVAP